MATLAHKPTPIETNVLDPFRLAVYGDGGAGKTTLALTFPFPLVIDLDGGLEGDAIAGDIIGEEWSPSGWADLNALIAFIKAKTEKDQYKTIVVDSIDTLCHFILHEATDMPTRGGRAQNASDDALVTSEQQDYNKVATAMDRFLIRLKILSRERGIHIVLTSAVRLPDAEKGRTKRTFDVQPAVEALVKQWANVYGELVVEELPKKEGGQPVLKDGKPVMEEHRILWTKASDRVRNNKSRWAALRPGVADPTFGRFVELIEKGTTEQ